MQGLEFVTHNIPPHIPPQDRTDIESKLVAIVDLFFHRRCSKMLPWDLLRPGGSQLQLKWGSHGTLNLVGAVRSRRFGETFRPGGREVVTPGIVYCNRSMMMNEKKNIKTQST